MLHKAWETRLNVANEKVVQTGQEPANYSFGYVGLTQERPLVACTSHVGEGPHRAVRRGGREEPREDGRWDYVEVFDEDWGSVCVQHSHEFYEFVLFREGKAIHVTDSGEIELGRGDAILIAPGKVHGYYHEEPACYTDVCLMPSWLVEDLKLLWGETGLVQALLMYELFGKGPLEEGMLQLKTSEEETKAWVQEILSLESESKKAKPSLVTIHGCFLKILGVLSAAYERQASSPGLAVGARLWSAAAVIERGIAEGRPLTREEAADAVGVSVRTLTRLFQEQLGMSVRDYCRQRRVARAQILLAAPEASITEAAHELGFSDLAHFSRYFSQATGMSPSQYRKSQRPKQAVAVVP